jgi:hypothetical protein
MKTGLTSKRRRRSPFLFPAIMVGLALFWVGLLVLTLRA